MLGLLHKVVLGIAPPHFKTWIYPAQQGEQSRGWAFGFQRHSEQLHDPICGATSEMIERSLFGLIYPYNSLPQHVVDIKFVKTFQRKLQNAVKYCAKSGCPKWELLLKQGARANGITSSREWF